MTKSIEANDVPLGVLDLLSDCGGAYGIGINTSAWVRSCIHNKYRRLINYELDDEVDEVDEGVDERIEDEEVDLDEFAEPDEHKRQRIEDKVGELIHDEYRPLMFRPDVIRASGVFPNKYRNTLLHTIGNKCWIDSYEWRLLDLMQ